MDQSREKAIDGNGTWVRPVYDIVGELRVQSRSEKINFRGKFNWVKAREREFLLSIHSISVVFWRDSRSACWLDFPAM